MVRAFREIARLNQSTFRKIKEASVIIVLDIDEMHCSYKSSMIPVHSTCDRTVAESLRMKPLKICFERKADSPSFCFFGKAVRKRRAVRPGSCAPRPDALASFVIASRQTSEHTLGNNFA